MTRINIQLLIDTAMKDKDMVLGKFYQDFKKAITDSIKCFPDDYKDVEWINAFLDTDIRISDRYSHVELRTINNISKQDDYIEIPGYSVVTDIKSHRIFAGGYVEVKKLKDRR